MFRTWLTEDGKTRVFAIGKFRFGRERPGVISPGPCWFCFYECWGHFAYPWWHLVWNVATEYKHDRHLIG